VEGPVGIRYEGDVMIVPIVEERLVTERRLVLTEELHIRREVTTRRVPQQVVLRKEQVAVERFDPRTHEWSAVETPAPEEPSTVDPSDAAAAGDSQESPKAPAT